MNDEAQRYSAFISYSHADHACARWLHRGLETYRLPKALVGSDTSFGPVTRRLLPVFRDRDELPASGDLGAELRAALAASRFQIVLCSPKSAQSHWVNEEILSFKRLHGESRTLALIVAGEPYAGGDEECFPPALRFRLAPDGNISNIAAEPIAADIRPGRDGRRLALLKLVAGLAGVRLDALARRDAARRQRRLIVITSLSLAVAAATMALAVYAESQRRVAEAQRRLADKSLQFLINTFQIANPATENPRTITAITILDRVSKRAISEMNGESAVSARLLQTTGEIYSNLGLPKESERDLRASLQLEPANGEERARTLLRLATLAFTRGDARESNGLVEQAERSYNHRASYAPELNALVVQTRGMTAYFKGDYADAARLLGEAAQDYEGLSGDYRQEIGRALMSQAQALVQLKRFNQAAPLLGRAVTIYVAKFGLQNVLTAGAIQNQALNDFERGDYGHAEKRVAQAVGVFHNVLDDNHPKLAAAYVLLGRIRTARGDAQGALDSFAKARSIFSAIYGIHNAAVGDVDFYAAEAASRSKDTPAALRMLDEAKRIYDVSYGPDDPDQVELLMARAKVLSSAGRARDSAESCAAAVLLQTRLDPKDPAIRSNQQNCTSFAAGQKPW